MKPLALFAITLTVGFAVAGVPKLNINPNTLTVSGISSGGAMATQFQVAHSSVVKGVGVIAGPPYSCVTSYSSFQCMIGSMASSIDVKLLANNAKANEAGKKIDGLRNMTTALVYMQSGTKDSVVAPTVMEKSRSLYNTLGVPDSNVLFNSKIPSQHAWITDNYGAKCDALGAPYINNCGVDTTGEMFRHLLQTNLPRVKYNGSALWKFSQKTFAPNGAVGPISLDESGFIYVPNKCRTQQCHLHVAFHGCAQGYEKVQLQFITKANLLEHAEANGIVVLFPQVRSSFFNPSNAQGCWDWFGYLTKTFATKEGPQVIAVAKMIKYFSNGLININ